MGEFKIRAKAVKELFGNGAFRIISFIPMVESKEIKLNRYCSFSCKGEIPFITIGETYDLILKELETNQYGTTYQIISCPTLEYLNELTDETELDILKQITTDKQAEYVNKAYPNFIRLVLEGRESEIDTNKIYNVGEVRAKAYIRLILEKYKYYAITQKYKEYEVNITDCKTLYEAFITDEEIEKAFNEKPYYVLIYVLGRSFERADRLLTKIRTDLIESDQRVEFMELDILDRNEFDGNSRLNGSVLFDVAHDYGMDNLLNKVKEIAVNSELIYYDEESKDLSRMDTYNAECMVADFISRKIMDSNIWDIDCDKYVEVDGFKLSETQSGVLKMICENDISILCGYSGCGKTSSVKALISMLEDNGYTYTLLAPTGKASRVMSQATNRKATTIHLKCLRDKEINSDVIIVDECSMINLETFSMLLKCIVNPKAKLLLVGDNAQLPAIGVGRIFSDLINSDLVPKTMLTEVFRYKSNGSLFVATNIRQGKSFFNDNTMVKQKDNEYNVGGNYRFIECPQEKVFDKVIEEYGKLINKGIKKDNIQIYSPFNVGSAGTYAINNTIQAEFNPPRPNELSQSRKIGGTTITFRENDLVINKKNDYKVLTYEGYLHMKEDDILSEDEVEKSIILNGQVGVVREVNKDGLVIQFDEQLLFFNKSKINKDLLLAYAISTHSSQGSTIDYSINIVSKMHEKMLCKELLYVSDTRNKFQHIDIGDSSAFNTALSISQDEARNTWMIQILNQILSK